MPRNDLIDCLACEGYKMWHSTDGTVCLTLVTVGAVCKRVHSVCVLCGGLGYIRAVSVRKEA
jgi:hypothetical protein